MKNVSISFTCQACGVKLTVPASLAGVTGPCPSCRSIIRAPLPIQQAPATPYDAFIHPATPPLQSIPADAPFPAAPIPTPPSGNLASLPEVTQPGLSTPQAAATIDPHPAPPAVLKPEPRQLPQRVGQAEVVAKQMPEAHSGDSLPAGGSTNSPKPDGKRLVWILVPLLFIIACGAIVFGLLTLVNKERDAKEKLPLDAPPRPSATVTPILPEDDPAPSKPETVGQPSPAMPFATSDLPSLSNTVPGQAAAEESQSPGVAALKVLETFLAATTLAERLPIIETKTALVDLASSCLVRPLPSAAGIATDAQESNAVERSVDIFYHVDFQTGSTTDLQTLLVRTRGTGSPKVVIDPFLDLYGGRLAAYASAPSEATGTFQAIVSAGAFCYEETIPNREKKLTLKLLARESVKEITKAYFGKQSRIGMMLEDENSGLRYGQARACTLVLRWNTEENPAMPYLEAIDVKTLDWNP